MNKEEEERGKVNSPIDEVLEKWVGQFGQGQFLHFTMAGLSWALGAIHTLVMIFADRTPDHVVGVPSSSANIPAISSLCGRSAVDQLRLSWAGGKGQSTVSEWGLVCDRAFLLDVSQSLFFVGTLLGSAIFGCLADLLGRKPALAVACVISTVCGLLTAASTRFWMYVVLRAFTGISCGGIGLAGFVLASEVIGPSNRAQIGMSLCYFYSLGSFLLAALAYIASIWAHNSWRRLYLITTAPSIMYCLLVLPFLSESPRWLFTQGRYQEAFQVLQSIASRNSGGVSDLPPAVLSYLVDSGLPVVLERKAASGGSNPIVGMLGVRGFPTMVWVWFACGMVYYGISLNVANLATNLYVSVVANAAAEVPAYVLTGFLVGRVGRRAVLIAALSVCTMACAVGSLVSAPAHTRSGSVPLIRLGCGVVAMFGMAGGYNLLYMYTCELFPTVVRSGALGMASLAAQIGAVIAPFVVLRLSELHPSLPFVVFTATCLFSAIVALQLTETLNKPLHDTFHHMPPSPPLPPPLHPLAHNKNGIVG